MIRRIYVKRWLVFDVLSVFPFDYVSIIVIEANSLSVTYLQATTALRVLRLLKLLSLLRLFRVVKLMHYLAKWEEVSTHTHTYIHTYIHTLHTHTHTHTHINTCICNMYVLFMHNFSSSMPTHPFARIANFILGVLLLAHWNGCIQFLIPFMEGFPPDSWVSINHLKV